MTARGIDAMTVEEVAREAEFAVGSVYRHFRSKEELLELLLIDLAQPLLEELEALPDSGLDFHAQLRAYASAVVQHATEDLPVFQAFMFAPGSLPPPGTEARDQLQLTWRRYISAVSQVLEVGQRQGVLASGDLLPPTLALAGMIYTLTRWSLFGDRALSEDIPTLVCRAFLQGFEVRASP
jgi:AcrR family transcriptional regulator